MNNLLFSFYDFVFYVIIYYLFSLYQNKSLVEKYKNIFCVAKFRDSQRGIGVLIPLSCSAFYISFDGFFFKMINKRIQTFCIILEIEHKKKLLLKVTINVLEIEKCDFTVLYISHNN